MRVRTLWPSAVLAVLSLPLVQGSPPISSSIVSNWLAPSFLVQYLECVSLESPGALFELLDGLPDSLFSPALLPSDTNLQLEAYLDGANLLDDAARESLRLSLANREGSVRVESMFKVHASLEAPACENWVDWYGQPACTVQQLWETIGVELQKGDGPLPIPTSGGVAATAPKQYPFDHPSGPVVAKNLPIAIFYASPTDPSFLPLYRLLSQLSSSDATRLQYTLRWKPSTLQNKDKLVLSGYGAGLVIKRTDYLVIDDRATGGAAVIEDVVEGRPKMMPLKQSDIAELGLRATSHILASSDPLAAFVELTSSFPLLASQLSTIVKQPLRNLSSELLSNQMSFQAASKNSFSLNGVTLAESDVDPFALLRLMRKERGYVNDIFGLSSLLTTKQARAILMSDGIGAAGKAGVSKDGRLTAEGLGELFDASDRAEGGKLLLWWNDLEKDKRYTVWPRSVREILKPVYPGQMNLVARNMNNVVLVLDLSRPESLRLIAESVRTYVSRGIPVRFGLVPQVGEIGDITTSVAQVIWYLVENAGRSNAMGFLDSLLNLSDVAVTEDSLRRAYAVSAQQLKHHEGGALLEFDAVLGEAATEAGTTRTDKARAYTRRLGVSLPATTNSPIGAFFMNGAHSVADDEFAQNLQKSLSLHVQFLQQQVYLEEIVDTTDVNTHFYDLPTTLKRRNRFIFPSEIHPLRIVNLVHAFAAVPEVIAKELHIQGVSVADAKLGLAEPTHSVTVYVVTDLNTAAGRALAREALTFVGKELDTRLALIHNPLTPALPPHAYTFSDLVYLLLESTALTDVLPLELIAWLDYNLVEDGPSAEIAESVMEENPILPWLGGAEAKTSQAALDFWSYFASFNAALGIGPGETGIVINGRVVGPLDPQDFVAADFVALKEFEIKKRILPVVQAITSAGFDLQQLEVHEQSQLISLLCSIMSEVYLPDPSAALFNSGSKERKSEYRLLSAEHTSIIDANDESSLFEIGVVIDPATELAQRWAPILLTLSKLPSIHLRIYLNPSRHLSELPIKRFYQFVFPSAPTFLASGLEASSTIRFEDIPEDMLLTFATDCHRSWLAFPKYSVHDLDNIRLADLPSAARTEGVTAVLELENLVVEGHARELPSSAAPRGLQLELSPATSRTPALESVDTIVMANLGYWQLKGNPGVWNLNIRSGKSSDVYKFESVGTQGWRSDAFEKTGNELVVTTLEGALIYPTFRRRKGMELVELLNESGVDEPAKGTGEVLVDKVKSMFPFFVGKTAPTDLVVKSQPEINIFTVASGLLYERMAFLMVVSVMRHTNSTVKFWFIQNFLSPSFRAFIPHMAREYNFEYELITYQWPRHWLRPQKEKQREIWGYKMLFLDVLFPLTLSRVIFVDSDQIVRTDLKALVDLKLDDGAPYAFAPMGDDRVETEGFRFWKTGYWKSHLKGATYHISALYVVDLDRFRQIAAGDRLRQMYQALSADPNSLANLDQDLPNNMQAAIPIHTLDRSWLWCETWCSDESLAQAKTIDLCNNPLTHEPKLLRAKRIIPEWTVYDDEVAALAQRVARESVASESEDAISAFGKKADTFQQAVQQTEERDKFVDKERIKDEL